MRRSHIPALRTWCVGIACAAAQLGACTLAHDDEGPPSRHLSAGTAEPGAASPDEVATSGPRPASAGAGSEDGDPAGPSSPGDVTATPVVQPTATGSPDAGPAAACDAAPAAAAATPVTALEATLKRTGDAALDGLLGVGEAVAIDGDTLAVAALRNSSAIEHGSVLVFVREAESWVQQAELLPPAGEPDSWFGQTLALSGDTLAVGAPEEWYDAPAGHGRVHVFTRTAGSWQLDATLLAEEPAERDYFGGSIALDGDTLAVTAQLGDIGRIELFERGESGFERTQTLRPEPAPETQAATLWVGPVVLDGDVLAASMMPAVDDPGQRVHVYERRDGLWQPTALVAGDRPGETFGIALALDGGTLVVGDSYLGTRDSGGTAPTGGAYVFERACDASWTQVALLTDDTEPLGGDFGRSVAVDGARVFVAEPSDPTAARGIDGDMGARDFDDDYTGAVTVFGRTQDGYERLSFLKPGATAPRETYFGASVAASGGRVVVGARGEDAAYVLH